MTEQEVPELTTHGPDGFGCAITSSTVGNGQPLALSGAGTVVAVVGANNVGKSTLLDFVHNFPCT
jgi:AAA15 family ATPase/GTPase